MIIFVTYWFTKISKFVLTEADHHFTNWNYKRTDPSVRHIGPYAQDFYAAFGLGTNDSSIATGDIAGVSLLAIQTLEKRTHDLKETKEELTENSQEIGILKSELEQSKNVVAEMQKKLDELQSMFNDCNPCGMGQESTMPVQNNIQKIVLDASNFHSILYQNEPNPFNVNTNIRYYIPENTGKAELVIMDATGKYELTRIKLDHRGYGQVEINPGQLAAGTYVYSLFVDGQFIDSKKMVIAK